MSTVNRMQVSFVSKCAESTFIETGGYTSFLYSGGIVSMPKNYKCAVLVSFPSCRSSSCSASCLAGNSENSGSALQHKQKLIVSIINNF